MYSFCISMWMLYCRRRGIGDETQRVALAESRLIAASYCNHK